MDAGRLQSVFDITVEDGSKVTLPESFSQSVRVDLVRDAVHPAEPTADKPTVLADTSESADLWQV